MSGKKRIIFEFMPYHSSQVFDLHFEFVGDLTKPPTRVEVEGDRAKKKFLVRCYQQQTLAGIVLCNQPDKVEAAKTQVRETPREIKKVVL
jgi:hypothetical protein